MKYKKGRNDLNNELNPGESIKKGLVLRMAGICIVS